MNLSARLELERIFKYFLGSIPGLPNCAEFSRLLQVKVNRHEVNRLALAKGAAEGRAAV